MAENEAQLVIDRRNESRKWFRKEYSDELTEVFRAIKCKTKPILKKDSAGNETNEEDKSRTNVCMPDLNLIFRRNTARMTAQPYRLKYRGGDDTVADMLSSLAMQQYDRSREPWHDRRIVMMGEAFGFGYSKLYWDTLTRTMQFRRAFMKGNEIVYKDRAAAMRYAGAPEEEISQAVQELGPELNDQEVASFIGKSGSEIVVPEVINAYEGPCVKSVFISRLHLPPGVLCLDDADFVIEEYQESDLWLQKMQKIQYRDPDSGQMVPVFDAKSCQELLDANPDPSKKVDDLEDSFEAAIGKQATEMRILPKRLQIRKKFDILEQHAQGEDGRMWITYVAEKLPSQPLGRMPYPVDMYGKSAYTEYVPLPDMISAYGDSTPRLLRHLLTMHNLTVSQNFDYVTNLLKLTILRKTGVNINNVTDRGNLKEVEISDLNGIQVQNLPQLPAAAFEREGQIMRMEAMAEPSMNTVDTGTASNPMAGKLATTAMLNAKAADALTNFKIDGRNMYLRELGQKKMWMNQQMASEPWRIESDFFTEGINKQVKDVPKDQLPEWALSDRNGKTVAIRLDPTDPEVQKDWRVEPEAGSYLSVDDEIRQASAQDLARAAQAAPAIFDQRKVARFYLSTIRGIGNPDDYILQPQPQAQGSEVKTSVSVSVKWPELTPKQQAWVLKEAGYPVDEQEVEAEQALHDVGKVADAANKAAELEQPVTPQSSFSQAKAE